MKETTYTLKALEGDLIRGIFIPIDPVRSKEVRLHRVEPYGIWIESQEVTEKMLAAENRQFAPQTLVFFLPWTQIKVIYAAVPIPALSETSIQA